MNGRKRDDDQHVLSDDGVMSYDVGTTKSITLLGYAFDLVVHRITVSGLTSVVFKATVDGHRTLVDHGVDE